jgi:hypothetical protein
MKKFTLLTGFAKIEHCFSKRVFQTEKASFYSALRSILAGPVQRPGRTREISFL